MVMKSLVKMPNFYRHFCDWQVFVFSKGDFCDAAHFCFLVYLISPISPLEDTTGRNNSMSF